MLTVSLLCQVRAARNYVSLCVNNLQMFFEVVIKGQFENKCLNVTQFLGCKRKGNKITKKMETNKQATVQNKATEKVGFLHK